MIKTGKYTPDELEYASNWILPPNFDGKHFVVYYKYEGIHWQCHYFNWPHDADAFYKNELASRINIYQQQIECYNKQKTR